MNFGAPPITPLDANRFQQMVDRQVKRVGMIATLSRSTGDRPCWIFFSQWTAKDLMGGLIDPLDRLVIMSALDQKIHPDHVQDRLITYVQPYDAQRPVIDENLRILQAPEKLAPTGAIICWKLRVRR
jgi:hypothetical protein